MKLRTIFTGAALALPLVLVGTTPAVAADVATIEGSGTIMPGLGPIPGPQTIKFTGRATATGDHAGVYDCLFVGVDLAGSVAEGVGTVGGSCGPLVFATCAFVREAAVVEVACAGGTGATVAAAVCAFTPVDTLPTTAYNLVCGALAV